MCTFFSLVSKNNKNTMQFKIVFIFLFAFAIGKFPALQGLTTKIYGNINFPYIGRALAVFGDASNNCTLITIRFPDVNFNVLFSYVSTKGNKFVAFVFLGRSCLRQARDPWH